MYTKRPIYLLLVLFVSLLAFVGAAPQSTQAAPPVPDGLTAADWAAIQSFLPSDYLKASNTGASDWFGGDVAVSGDTVVVGAIYEDSAATGVNGDQTDNSATYSGAAYVFTRTDGVWSQEAYLKASNTGADDYFGYAVAVSGDTVVVGAPSEDSNATGVNGDQADNSANNSGAAYLFTRTDGVWSQQAYLKASNTDAGDYFGWDVAVSGDTVVVGAVLEDSAATGVDGDQADDNSAADSGAAYLFTRTDGVWSQQAYLKASNTDAGDRFGDAVAVSGDTVMVGASWEDSAATGVDGDQTNNSASFSGAAYVFTHTNGVWSQQAYLKASNTDGGDDFGYAVAVSGDTVVVGARYEDSNATGVDGDQADNSTFNSGAAYVFTRTGGVWSQQAYLKASNTGAYDQFGRAVAVSGDTVVVGAYWEDSNATGVNGNEADNSATDSGAAYLFGNSRYTLTIALAGDGSGTVSSDPAGIMCGAICELPDLAAGSVVTLTAVADPGYLFTSWSGDLITTTNPLPVTMNSAKTITATFALNQYSITLTVEPAEGGMVTGGGEVAHGQMVTTTAVANPGYTFLHWTENGEVVSTDESYSFMAVANRALVAHFTADTPIGHTIYLPLIVR